jgi:hypothetical protein
MESVRAEHRQRDSETAAVRLQPADLFGTVSLKRALVPLLSQKRVAQGVKWLVYTCLLLNFGQYLVNDFNAWQATRGDGAALAALDLLSNFATSIDTVAWVMLIVVLEFETYIVSDAAYTRTVRALMLAVRALCYTAVFAAAWGYLDDTLDYYRLTPLGDPGSLCALAEENLFLQLNAIDYVEISPFNCTELHHHGVLFRVDTDTSVIDAPTLEAVRRAAWMDVSNAVVWILVVILIELEVRLQTQDRFFSRSLLWLRAIKTIGYLVLVANGVVWAFSGYGLFAWDAFLWIFGFWAIELNLAEWEIDRVLELESEAPHP